MAGRLSAEVYTTAQPTQGGEGQIAQVSQQVYNARDTYRESTSPNEVPYTTREFSDSLNRRNKVRPAGTQWLVSEGQLLGGASRQRREAIWREIANTASATRRPV